MATVEDVAAESRENIPLQKGRKTTGFCSEEYFSGTKFINVAFGSLTVIITVALIIQIYYGDYQIVPHGSVATDSLECSKIGTSILKNGGNSIDAAIGSAFCLSVVTPHLTSLESDGLLMIYNHRTRLSPEVIDFRGITVNPEQTLPRLVVGLGYLHQKYGSIAWKDLVQPSADIAKKGFLIPKMLVQAIRFAKVEDLYGHLEAGQILQLDALSMTLQQLADIPEKDLYEHINKISQPLHSQALKYTFSHYDVFVPNTPSIGPTLLTNLQQLEALNFSRNDSGKTESTYRVAETTQTLYEGLNVSSKFHQGVSTNVAVMDLDDTYVALSMGLFSLFGSGETTTGGYIVDTHSSTPCSRVPIIITDATAICGRRLVTGANDMSTATQLIVSLLVADENVTDAVEAPRFHILSNGSVGIEGIHSPLFSDDVLKYLETLTAQPLLVPEPYMSINVVEKIKDDLNSHSDSRGGGIASRF